MTDWWNSVLEEWRNIIQRRMSCCVERKSHKNGIAMELEKEEKKHSLIIIGPRGETDRGTVWFFSQPQININTFTIVIIIIIIDMVV